MTKFLLHGWLTSPRTEKNKKFFQEIVKSWWNKILIFPFAQKNRDYQLQFELDSQKFIDHNKDIDIECVMASDDIEVLVEQMKEYNLLYFCGWLLEYHLEILRKIDNLKDILKNKVISWNSSGSLIWSKYVYDQDIEKTVVGLGLLDVKMITHWGTDKYPGKEDKTRLLELENYKEKLPIYKIREQEYEVFEI